MTTPCAYASAWARVAPRRRRRAPPRPRPAPSPRDRGTAPPLERDPPPPSRRRAMRPRPATGSSAASSASSSASAVHLESIGRRRPSGRSSPNSTTLPPTRKSVTSMPGGSCDQVLAQDVLARPTLRGTARQHRGEPADHFAMLGVGPAAFLLAHGEFLRAPDVRRPDPVRSCSDASSRLAAASARRRSSAACTSRRASRRAERRLVGRTDGAEGRRVRCVTTPIATPTASGEQPDDRVCTFIQSSLQGRASTDATGAV